MGGSGGYFGTGDLDYAKRQLQAESQAKDQEYLSACNDFLASLLANYNDRDIALVRRRLAEIEEALGQDLAGTIDIIYGGSVAKNTYVDGLSDIDSLVMLDSCELAAEPPSNAKEHLAHRLLESFPSATVKEGTLAVTISFPDIDIQLLPAVSCRNDVKISDTTGNRWAMIRPREFTRALTDRNDEVGKKLVPTIKLAKAAIAMLPEPQRITGYHAEALAVDVFRDYKGPYTHKEMLQHFFARSSERVRAPIRDKTGQSLYVDEALGTSDSLARRIVSDAFGRLARRMVNADSAGRIEDWQQLFGAF